MTPIQTRILELQKQNQDLYHFLQIDQKKIDLKTLQTQTTQPGFWQNQNQARQVTQRISVLETTISTITSFHQKLTQLSELAELTPSSTDSQIETELNQELDRISYQLTKLKLQSYLSGPYDHHSAIVTIFSGQGGIEAMDWAAMLVRMYLRYFDLQNWEYELTDQSTGEEAGIKSATYLLKTAYSFGYLKGEQGTHRLVRLSPFNADNLRQTSFAGVEILPFIDNQDSQIIINDADLEWQFFRSGGSGGQNVNKVNTAVRVKHLPTGLVITSQAQRSQQQNRKIALNILESKLWNLQQAQLHQTQAQIKGHHQLAGWGNQIRSYVLHPYQMVKDNRTGIETSDTQAVLDGHLDQFIEAQLIQGISSS